MLRFYCVCIYLHICLYVHTCMHIMFTLATVSCGGQRADSSEEWVLSPTMWAPGIYRCCRFWPQEPLFPEPSRWPEESSLRGQTDQRPRVQRSDAIGSAPVVRQHAVEELGRAQMFTSWHLGSRGRKRMRHALPRHAAPWPTS